jgi:hypothetical protein
VPKVVIVAACVSLFLVAPALARPHVEQVDVQFGVVAELAGAGCTSASLSRPAAGDDPLSFDPAVGDEVGYVDALVVTGTALGAGQATWTVQPTAEECALYQDDPSWTWSTDERAWAVTHRVSAYTIRASRHNGVRSIAGFRVNGRSRGSAPTIRKARRHFGKPSFLHRRYGVGCRARWNRIGLTIDLLNLGGRHPCRHGFVQAGTVKGPAASKWAAVVAGDSGVALGTSDAFLESELVGEPGGSSRAWTLADVFVPYGDASYDPSLSALLRRNGAVRGFEFWVGAGGD